jgi:HSP90 family molecular chaperone
VHIVHVRREKSCRYPGISDQKDSGCLGFVLDNWGFSRFFEKSSDAGEPQICGILRSQCSQHRIASLSIDRSVDWIMRATPLLVLAGQLLVSTPLANTFAFVSPATSARRPASSVTVGRHRYAPGALGGSGIVRRMSAETEAPPQEQTGQKETFQFQAEVSRVMNIIIHSLYSNRDVFLRELISNAADACDKKRFLAIGETAEADTGDYRIRVKADKEARTLTIVDTGVGMTKEELINNLGSIAQSGTAKFMEALGSGKADMNLIGQFGVGFYSGFLVADKVTVVTKSCQGDGKQWVWESERGESYTVSEDVGGEPIEGSGSRLILHLKDDAEEYLDDFKLKELCMRYSEFVSFPIDVWAETTKYEQVPDPDAEVIEGEEPKTKTVTKTVWDWELMNKMKPIWMRNPKEVTDGEYEEFYKSTFKAWDDVLTKTHFSLEGQVEFKALLYVPSVLPYGMSRNMFDDEERAMRLYVKRVFINDKFEELVPRWLMFLRGIVDSEDLPLNVGREILQRSKMLTVISKRIVRKSIDMFRDLKEAEDQEKWNTFWGQFGKYLKVGIVEDEDNKDELAKLVRFPSTKASGKNEGTHLDEYVKNMKEGQPAIYYVVADSAAAANMSPALEKAKKLGYEVLFMLDPLDELCAGSIESFEDKRLVDLTKEDVDLGTGEEEKKKKEEQSETTQEFRTWLKDILGDRVQKVEISSRLVDSPAALVQGAYGMSPTMKRYMKAQGMSENPGTMGMGNVAPTMEVNMDHPILQQLQQKHKALPEGQVAKDMAILLYDVASLAGGYNIDEPVSFAQRITQLMMKDMPMASSEQPAAAAADEDDDGPAMEAEIVN